MRNSKNSPLSKGGRSLLPHREIDRRWSLAPYLAFLMALLYALPTVGAIFLHSGRFAAASTESYLLFALCLIISAGIILHTRTGLRAVPKAVLGCFLISLGIYTAKLILYALAGGSMRDGFQMWRERTLGFVFALAVCACFALFTTAGSRRRFLALLSTTLTIVFLLQVSLSFYQARTGIVLEQHESEIAVSAGSLYTRDLLTQTNWSILNLGLSFPVTGLLGQYNRFGVVCVFFNLLFLARLANKWHWIYLFLAGGALVAALLNTTKTAIIAIVITDVLVLCLNRKIPTWVRSTIFLAAAISGLIYGIKTMELILYQSSGQLTLTIRGDMWTELWRLYKIHGLDSIAHVMFGLDFSFFLTQGISRSGSMLSFGSYENEAFMLIFNFGLLGFAAFVYAFYVDAWRLLPKVPQEMKLIFWLLPFNILLCSLTMDCQTKWYSLPLIMVIFLSCLSGQERPPDVEGLRGSRQPRSTP